MSLSGHLYLLQNRTLVVNYRTSVYIGGTAIAFIVAMMIIFFIIVSCLCIKQCANRSSRHLI